MSDGLENLCACLYTHHNQDAKKIMLIVNLLKKLEIFWKCYKSQLLTFDWLVQLLWKFLYVFITPSQSRSKKNNVDSQFIKEVRNILKML